uniref:Uncharacterized protein n=1 Tax=Acrobeloides nanus TaxID=290746 RepID=A0A914BWG6_9BILA
MTRLCIKKYNALFVGKKSATQLEEEYMAASLAFLRLLAILGALAWRVDAQTATECVQALTQAQMQWNTIANISNTALNWNDPDALRTALEGAFAQGSSKVTTFKQVCRGHKQYKSYLGASYSYNGCLNPRVLIADDSGKSTNISEHNARVYLSITYAFDFICGAGYPIFTNNAECMGDQIFNINRGAIDGVFFSFWYAAEQIYHQDGRFNPANAQVYCSELAIAATGDVTKRVFDKVYNTTLVIVLQRIAQLLAIRQKQSKASEVYD